ncbi:putative side fiber protein [Escherichia coli]|uniref:Putative side fiber protein n=1 Tax=Escherichia coli TaxID=562 RepID=A0A2X3JKE7_ECOLX|nr:putative side fiber protein [Escherichia coli]
MAVKISGVLKDGTGKPVQNCTIQLKAKRNSSTVVVNTVASENPDEAGRYSMDVEVRSVQRHSVGGRIPAVTCRDHHRV